VDERDLVALLGFIEAGFNGDDLDRLDEVLAPDVVVHGPFPVEPGAESLKGALGAIRRAFPDSHVTIDDIAQQGPCIYRRWTFVGRHGGELFGIPATGREVRMSGVDVERFEGGRIVEHWSFWDRLTMMEQLGVAPAGGGGAPAS
jgi:steroid delta-isomerase-like uncharacterized protein